MLAVVGYRATIHQDQRLFFYLRLSELRALGQKLWGTIKGILDDAIRSFLFSLLYKNLLFTIGSARFDFSFLSWTNAIRTNGRSKSDTDRAKTTEPFAAQTTYSWSQTRSRRYTCG